ncbi:hypothetical protein HDV00_008303 [Rhizophlyctis rosea]|nr:hypothetical protein HDV00_008303 [Rhizophlyctis rosea]
MTSGADHSKIDSFQIGRLFVHEYYTFLTYDPSKLHLLFEPNCSHKVEQESVRQCHGLQEIYNRVAELTRRYRKVSIKSVDSQPSFNGGIVIQVLGEMSNKGQSSHKFAQTFFLAEQPTGFYIWNDIFHFTEEDLDDNLYKAVADTAAKASTQKQMADGVAPIYHKEFESPKKIEKACSTSSVQTESPPEKVSAPVVPNSAAPSTNRSQQHATQINSGAITHPKARRDVDNNVHAASESNPAPLVVEEMEVTMVIKDQKFRNQRWSGKLHLTHGDQPGEVRRHDEASSTHFEQKLEGIEEALKNCFGRESEDRSVARAVE